MRATEQRSANLEQDAWQPRLAMEADVTADNKTHKHTEGAAAAVHAKHGDSCSTKRVHAGPTSSTSFGIKAELPTFPPRDDILVDKGAAAPKPCLSPVEMRTRTSSDGLLPAGTASAATMTIFHQLPLWFYSTKEIKSRTSKYATD